MPDRPIIFSAPMVRALIDGRKTQTRRILKPQPDAGQFFGHMTYLAEHRKVIARNATGMRQDISVPYAPGDRLYVREAHALVPASAYRMSEGVAQAVNPSDRDWACIYREGFDRSTSGNRWRPSIHMPRWASRLTLTVTEVRVQRVQEISEEDARAEGCGWSDDWEGFTPCPQSGDARYFHSRSAVCSFEKLWSALHGDDAWDANPWVVAVTFTVKQGNIDDA